MCLGPVQKKWPRRHLFQGKGSVGKAGLVILVLGSEQQKKQETNRQTQSEQTIEQKSDRDNTVEEEMTGVADDIVDNVPIHAKDCIVDTGLISAIDNLSQESNISVQITDQIQEADMMCEIEVAKPVPRKRKTKGASSTAQAKKSQIDKDSESAEMPSQCENSQSEDCDSDFSLVSEGKKRASQEKIVYTARLIKQFLQDTKNMKVVKVEDHFADKKGFYESASLYMRDKEDCGFTNQKVYRLKKLVLKVKRERHRYKDSRESFGV